MSGISFNMHHRTALSLLCLVSVIIPLLGLTGCAATDPDNTQLERRLQERNSSYEKRMDRRELRRKARDERFDRWFEAM